MKIKYVGVKEDGETAFGFLSGIERWMPGESNEVKDGVATRMLSHPDVFALDESTGEPVITLQPVAKPVIDPEALILAPGAVVENPESIAITVDGVVTVLDGMDKDELHALAKELDVAIHFKSGPAKVIAALQAAFPAEAE